MNVTFLDMEDEANELNGTVIRDSERLLQILDELCSRPPFVCELVGDNGFHLHVGIGKFGHAQYSRSDGEPPYLVAVAPGKEYEQEQEGDETEFSCGGTATPISNRYCMPFELVREIARYFLETGRAHPNFFWKEV